MTPEISIVMPVYNAEKYLAEAIQSILDQTYTHFEFIIINDGSTDNSLNIIKKYKAKDNRILLINRENKGIIKSLNEGIEQAQGKYIARMDADDINLPNRLEKQIKFMKKENLDACGCHYFLINDCGSYVDSATVPLTANNFINYLSITTPFCHPSVIIKKEFMTSNNIYYGKGQYKVAEDYILWVNFFENNAALGNVDEFLFKYREYEQSLSHVNKTGISSDKRKIAKSFILKHKEKLINNFNKDNINLFPKKEIEIVVLILFILLRYDFSMSHIKILKKINKRPVICGFFKFIKERYYTMR